MDMLTRDSSGGHSGMPELRLILVGNIGCGKTLTADTLLNDSSSISALMPSRLNEVRRGVSEGRHLRVVETPRWYWKGEHVDVSVQTETERSLSLLAPGPHAFLILVPVGQFTTMESRIPAELERVFGKGALEHSLVVLTCGDYLVGRDHERYVRLDEPGLSAMVNECGGRWHVINNRRPDDREQVISLLEKVEQLAESSRGCYLPSAMQREVEDRVRERERELQRRYSLREELVHPEYSAPNQTIWSKEETREEMGWRGKTRVRSMGPVTGRAVSQQLANGLHSQSWYDDSSVGVKQRSSAFKLSKEGAILSQMSETDEPGRNQYNKNFVNTIHYQINTMGDTSSPPATIPSPTVAFNSYSSSAPFSSFSSDTFSSSSASADFAPSSSVRISSYSSASSPTNASYSPFSNALYSASSTATSSSSSSTISSSSPTNVTLSSSSTRFSSFSPSTNTSILSSSTALSSSSPRTNTSFSSSSNVLSSSSPRTNTSFSSSSNALSSSSPRTNTSFLSSSTDLSSSSPRTNTSFSSSSNALSSTSPRTNTSFSSSSNALSSSSPRTNTSILSSSTALSSSSPRTNTSILSSSTALSSSSPRTNTSISSSATALSSSSPRTNTSISSSSTALSSSSPSTSPSFFTSSTASSSSFSSGSSDNLRLVLVGRSGSGKSAAGNTILGRDEFKLRRNDATGFTTQSCAKGTAVVGQKQVAVVDTPDWFGPSCPPEKLATHVSSCINLSAPGPHAFLLCVPVTLPGRSNLYDLVAMRNSFGADAITRRTLVLFTHSDILKDGNVEEYIAAKRPELLELVEKCGDHYHVLKHGKNGGNVEELLEKVEQMVKESGASHYSYQGQEEFGRETTTQLRKGRGGGDDVDRAVSATLHSLREEEEVEQEEKNVKPAESRASSITSVLGSVLRFVGQKVVDGAKLVPKPTAGGAVLGGVLGLYVGGPVGGAVGATAGSVAAEYGRRKYSKPKTD